MILRKHSEEFEKQLGISSDITYPAGPVSRKYWRYLILNLIIALLFPYIYITYLAEPEGFLNWPILLTISAFYLITCVTATSYGIYVLALFAPLQFKGVNTSYGVLSVTDVMILELLFVWLTKKLYRDSKLRASTNKAFVIIWLLFCLLSFINTFDLKNSLEFFLRLLSSIVLFLIICDQIKKPEQVFNTVKALIYSSFFLSLYGLWEYFVLKKEIPLLIDGQLNNFKRVSTFFNQPNETAAYLVIVIPLTIFFVIREKRKVVKYFYSIILFMSASCLFFTFSRAGWLCSALSVLFLPVRRRVKILLIVIMTSFLLTALGFMLTARQKSIQRRLYRYKAAIPQFLNRPFLGHGLGTYQRLHQLQEYDLPSEQVGKGAHSLYVSILVEIGIGGFIFFLLFLLSTAKKIITPLTKLKSLKMEYRHVKVFSCCLLSSFLGLFLMKSFETGLTKLSMWVMLAIYNTYPLIFLRGENGKTEYAARL